ncbi:MAG: ABC transporter substrate-binding protein [Bacteroidales bacterium]|jgi:peptide/nickel transport system substrate-binding protein|nr:ABC transporter substrate-binding protein [Bacteroidales bacterium]MDD4703139.1 ABC transporter substrate-binding protein [Bacteroidales bacterium]MDX9797425.1 ABC transporter substrate-binding protein [Bacteroidales bacterium]
MTNLLDKNKFCSVLIFIFIISLLSSCKKYSTEEGTQIFRYNESANISSLDPAFAKDQAMIWANLQIFNGLVQLDSSLNIKPSIAKSWEISDDGLVYTFILRDDVCFHEHSLFKGKKRKVIAKDFEYSFNRILDEKVASPGAWIFNLVKLDALKKKYSFKAINDSTFKIELKEAFSPFLGLLTMPYASVVPKEIVEHYGEDFRKNPIGTGPFYFKLWKEGVKLVLLKNKDYFEKDSKGNPLPYLDAINISFIVDKQSVFLEFVKGNIDFISGIDPNYKDEILTRHGTLQDKYRDKINLTTEPYLNTEYLGFMVDREKSPKDNPLLNKKIRQAINYGFDREKMIKYLRNNIGLAGTNGIIPKGLAGFDTSNSIGYNYNPEKAKLLLQEAGYPNGNGLPPISLATTSTYLDLCKYIQGQLNLLGFDIKIDVNPPGALREHIAQSKIMWFRGSWIADYPDAENYLSLFYSPNFCPRGPNYTHFSNKTFDKLFKQAQKETSLEKRTKLYRDMDKLIMEEAPIVILYYDQVLRFSQKNIEGLSSNPMNLLILKNVRKN